MDGASTDVVVPQLGEVASDVVLVRWLKREGDEVRKGEPLFELDTDKYVVEIQAVEDGTLVQIVVSEREEVSPLQVVARLLPAAASVASGPSARAGRRVLASPKARSLAGKLGGLITAEDVRALAAREAPVQAATTHVPLSRARRAVAARTQASKREAPHFYLLADADMSEALRLRAHCAEALGWERLPSYTDLLVAACARALGRCPEANVVFSEEGLRRRESVDVGVAVALDDGLLSPVVRDAGALGLRELSERRRALVARARRGRLTGADAGERSIVVSNLGMYGVDAFIAIIDLPDPMILAAGRVAERCVPVDGVPAVRPACTLALSVDHRALDGVVAARFLGLLRESLEEAFVLLGEGAE
jgi:pyruvate dehydrogenase E2 component (dihydrolipoamide acetyltransferase)